MTPLRIQRSRTRGSKLPPNTICVTRPGLWSNPFVVGQPSGVFSANMGRRGQAEVLIQNLTIEQSLEFYTDMLRGFICPEMHPHGHNWMERFHKKCGGHPSDAARHQLRGHNLACFCHLCPAHALGKPFDLVCVDCAPCHADRLGMIANS